MFLIYLKKYCPYSSKAKLLLEKYKLKFRDIMIDDNLPLRSNVMKKYNHSTMPIIFYCENDIVDPLDNIFIGGSDKLANLIDNLSKLNKTNIKETYDNYYQDTMTYKQFLKIALEF